MLDFEYVEEEEPANFVQPENLDISYKRKTVVISSADRNLNTYPNPSNYEVTLKEPINDVSEITLVEGNIPSSQYNINKFNNVLHFTENIGNIISEKPFLREVSNVMSITIPEGNYDTDYEDYGDGISKKDKLSEEIEKGLNKIGQNSYKVTYEPSLNKYRFSSYFKDDQKPTYFKFVFEGKETPYGEYSYEKSIKRDQHGSIIYDSYGNKVYEDIFIGENTNEYPKNSIGKTLGFLNKNYDGFIEGNVSSDESNNRRINGQHTYFTRDLQEGSFITIVNKDPDSPIQSFNFQIETIENDYELLVSSPIETDFSDYQIISSSITSPNLRDLFPYNPVALQIPKCRRLSSHNPIINNSFCLFESLKSNDSSGILYYDDNQTITKTFNPPLGKLDKIKIRFFNTQYYGSYYDFGGRDHKLTFKITHTAQSHKYYQKRLMTDSQTIN